MRLDTAEQTFTDDLRECSTKLVDKYQHIACDYRLCAAQKLQYLHNIVVKDAQRFYFDNFQCYATKFQQTVDKINQKLSSPFRQTRFKTYLNRLQVADSALFGQEIFAALAKSL